MSFVALHMGMWAHVARPGLSMCVDVSVPVGLYEVVGVCVVCVCV